MPGLALKHKAVRGCLFLLAAVAVTALFRLHNPSIPGTDSFRHFRHAALYAQHGPFMSDYPWLPFSVVSRWASDLWYGFHLLLIPFTYIPDPIFAIKLASICETVVLLLMLYVVMRRHQIVLDYAWPFVLFFFAPATLYGLLMTRPHVLTMALAALLFSYLVTDSRRGAFVSSLLLSWVHVNFFWVVPVTVGVVGLAKLACERVWAWRCALAALVGMTLGWLLRPHPVGSAKLLYVQLVELTMARRHGVPLMYADELKPVPLPQIASGFLYVLLIWLAVTVIFLIGAATRRAGLSRRDHTLLWSSLALTVLFFAMTAFDTRRAVVLWMTFGVVFTAAAFSRLLDPTSRKEQLLAQDTRGILAACLGIVFLLMIGAAANQHLLTPGMWRGDAPTVMQGPGEWLKANARPDEIVFNVNWGDFQTLFFWDPRNRYTSGLDPIFLYSFDHELYWKAHHLQTGEATAYTWATPEPRPRRSEDTYTVLTRDFHAGYVMVRRRDPRYQALWYYLQSDPRFQLAFEDQGYAIFRLGRG